MGRRATLLALDVGTSKVAAIVAQARGGGAAEVRGLGVARCRGGMKKGVVVDFDAVAGAIADAVDKAERMAGARRFTSAYVGVSGPYVRTHSTYGVVASEGDGEIVQSDVARVLEAAACVEIPTGYEILHVIPKGFCVDGYDGIRDPVGMRGTKLEVHAQVVLAESACVENLLRAVYRSGLDTDGAVLSALAAGEAVLEPEEKESGVAVVDVGAGTTDIATFVDGSLRFVSTLPLGGGHVTSDLMVGLKVPMEEAEKIKVEGQGNKNAESGILHEIVDARVKEIACLVAKELERSGSGGCLPAGLVLVGGSAKLAGLAQALREAADVPVRVGYPKGVTGLTGMVSDPSLAVVVGMAQLGLEGVGTWWPAEAAASTRPDARRRRSWGRPATQLRGLSSVKGLGLGIIRALDQMIGDWVRDAF